MEKKKGFIELLGAFIISGIKAIGYIFLMVIYMLILVVPFIIGILVALFRTGFMAGWECVDLFDMKTEAARKRK